MLKQVKVNYRNLAEALWGRGGTKAHKTNRKGAYYYSCSGHGGYLVNAQALTPSEIESLNKFIKPIELPVLVGPDSLIYGVDYASQSKYGTGKRRFLCPQGSKWESVQVYVFEEDCDWAVLETLTDIRIVRNHISSESLSEARASAFKFITERLTA